MAENHRLVSSEALGESYGQLAIPCFRVKALGTARRKVLIVGGHHGCERIGVEIAFLLGKELIQIRTGNRPATKLPSDLEIVIIPMLNPDGHVYATSAWWNWRKNRSPQADTFGVDLNRNYPIVGEPGISSDTAASDYYRGPRPLSETETQAVANLLERESFDALLTYHSFGQVILYPWASQPYSGGDSRIEGLRKIAKQMAAASTAAGLEYAWGPASDFYNDVVGGDLCDWALDTYGICGLTVELSPGAEPGSSGFALPASQIQTAFLGHLPAALLFLNWAYRL